MEKVIEEFADDICYKEFSEHLGGYDKRERRCYNRYTFKDMLRRVIQRFVDENLKTSPNNNFKAHSDSPKFSPDNIFIKHIEAHSEVQNAPTHQGKAMCKVCGKLAEDIIKEAKTS